MSSFQTVLKPSSLLKLRLKNSGLDNDALVTNQIKIDNSYIEGAIFTLFKINIIEYVKVKAILAKQFHIQPSEIDNMPYWEYEIFVKHINDLVENENNQQEQAMNKYHVDEYMNMARPGNMQKMMSNAQPKMPDMSKMSMPNFGSSMKFP